MALPIIAVVGRPNVGKSSLFNRLAGWRISIVDPTAGVTRDRVSTVLEAGGRFVELMDTGGMGIADSQNLTDDVERQINLALDAAAVVVFLVDVRDGVMPLDQHVAERLRGTAKPVVFAANKADDPKFDDFAAEFFQLGYGEPILVSANSGRGQEDLFAAVLAKLPPDSGEPAPANVTLKLAIVGKRNVGKSTFINALTLADRVIVSETAGTTRDSVDVRFDRDGKSFLAIDTAGVRKKTKLADSIEFYSLHRAERSIRRADVVLHFLDSRTRIGRVDKQLCEYVLTNHKPAIFVVNKWDLVKGEMNTAQMGDYVKKIFPMLDYVPIAFATATTGKNAYRILNLAQELHKAAGKRVTTGVLNRVVQAAVEANPPPMRQNKQGRIYFATQIAVNPPTIALVTNGPDLFDNTYLRYLLGVVREETPFAEVPIKLVLRAKGEGGGFKETEDAEEAKETPRSRAAKPVKKRKKRGSTTWDV
jgi:GTP-binding protein